MALRWRKEGKLLCAAKHLEKRGDTYIDDRLHYRLSVELKIIAPSNKEKINGRWYWLKDVFPVIE